MYFNFHVTQTYCFAVIKIHLTIVFVDHFFFFPNLSKLQICMLLVLFIAPDLTVKVETIAKACVSLDITRECL